MRVDVSGEKNGWGKERERLVRGMRGRKRNIESDGYCQRQREVKSERKRRRDRERERERTKERKSTKKRFGKTFWLHETKSDKNVLQSLALSYFSPFLNEKERKNDKKRCCPFKKSCGHWMMPMLWSGGREDKISNKLAGDVAFLSGSMVQHQPCLLGSRVRLPAGAFATFSVSAKASLPISNNLSPFPFSFPYLYLSFALKISVFASRKNEDLEVMPEWKETAHQRTVCILHLRAILISAFRRIHLITRINMYSKTWLLRTLKGNEK